MAYLLAAVLLGALLFGPQLWTRHILRHYERPRPDFPGTGGELARHLLSKLGLEHVQLTVTESGDHYDPIARRVALTESVHDGRSLTAVVVAAHEVGHALQHHCGYQPLLWRTRLAGIAQWAERFGSIVLVTMPVLAAVTRVPAVGAVQLLAGIAILGVPVLLHLITLPVELDASFRRALPLLRAGYLEERDLPAARRILGACAMTYVAGSLATLLNFWRWIRILRR